MTERDYERYRIDEELIVVENWRKPEKTGDRKVGDLPVFLYCSTEPKSLKIRKFGQI